MKESELLVEVGSAAKILGVGPTRVRDLEREGVLPALRTVGRGQRLFRLVDVRQLAADRAHALAAKEEAAQ